MEMDEGKVPLRQLRTDNFEGSEAVCPTLETPNVLDGMAAALLTHCQIDGIPAAMFVAIQGDAIVGPDLLQALEPVLPLVRCPIEFVTVWVSEEPAAAGGRVIVLRLSDIEAVVLGSLLFAGWYCCP